MQNKNKSQRNVNLTLLTVRMLCTQGALISGHLVDHWEPLVYSK
jgi:hypothetical protein